MKTLSILFISFLLILNSAYSQQEIIPFESDRWDKEQARQAEFLGRQCLMGIATLKDVEFTNGVIEFDLAVTGERSYPGVTFRAQSNDDYERIYIRPHLPKPFRMSCNMREHLTALIRGSSIMARGKQQALHSRKSVVSCEDRGKRHPARLFINDPENPVLTITELAHGLSKGTVGVWGPADGSAYFSNFSYRNDNTLQFPDEILPDNPTGIITDWEISQPDKLTAVDMEIYPEAQGIENIKWQKVQSLPSGLVDISRYYGEPDRRLISSGRKQNYFPKKSKQNNWRSGIATISVFS